MKKELLLTCIKDRIELILYKQRHKRRLLNLLFFLSCCLAFTNVFLYQFGLLFCYILFMTTACYWVYYIYKIIINCRRVKEVLAVENIFKQLKDKSIEQVHTHLSVFGYVLDININERPFTIIPEEKDEEKDEETDGHNETPSD